MKNFKKFLTFITFIICLLAFPSKDILAQPLSGNYTVDTTGSGNFKSINAAARALNNRGVSGPVTINIKPGQYNENVQLDSIGGASQQNTITFQSSTQDTSDVEIFQVEKNDKAVVFELTKTDHITFRDLKVAIKSSEYVGIFHAFNINPGVTHLTIKNCRMEITPKQNDNKCIYLNVGYQEASIKEVVIANNYMSGGGAKFFGKSNNPVQDITVKANEIFAETGLQYRYSKNILIKNNELSTNSQLSTTTGIKILYSSNIDILKNKIAGYVEGLHLGESDDFKAQALVANNFISATRFGISSNELEDFNGEFYYNSVNITNDGSQESSAVTFSHNSIYKNNIFANKNGPVLATSDTSSFVANHNNYFTNAKDFGIIRTSGFNNYDTISNLSDYQQKFNEGQNAHQFKPGFVSDSDLHATNNNLKGEATPIGQITEDIDGDQRDAQNPDIGADEIIAVPDLVVNSASLQPQSIETDESFKVNWSVKNEGGLSVKSPWQDGLYLSRDQQLDQEKDYRLDRKQIRSDLKTGDSYFRQSGYQFPFTDSSGTFYVLVNTNDTGTIDDIVNNSYVIGTPLNVTLSDRPELAITNINVPTSINSGEKLKVTYTVKNTGKEQTEGTWQDAFYLSGDSASLANQIIPVDSSILKQTNKQAQLSLKPGETYKSSVKFDFPLRFSGQYYIKGYTDFHDDIPEIKEREFNTRVSESFQVQQTPIADLIVRKINADPQYFSGEYAHFNYTIENIGSNTVRTNQLEDLVGLIKGGGNAFTRLNTRERKVTIKPGNSLKVFDSVQMPECVSDTFQLQVSTDNENRVQEFTKNNNANLSNTFELIIRPKPDLKVTNVAFLTPNPTTEQNNVRATLTIKNDGNADYNYPIDGMMYNGLYLSKDNQFNLKEDRFLRLKPMKVAIKSGQSKRDTLSFKMPPDVPGDYFLYGYTDKSDAVCEVPFENNNTGKTTSPTTIQLAPKKDLSPVDLQFNTTDRKTGEQINVSAKIDNQGPGAIAPYQWEDAIYLVNAANQKETKVKVNKPNAQYNAQTPYFLQNSFDIPLGLPTGDYSMKIKVDDENDVYEHQAEQNNAITSNQFKIERDPDAVSDLFIQSLKLTNTPKSGNTLKFTYTTKNGTSTPTPKNGWKNRVKLLNTNDKVVASEEILHFGKLAGNQTQQNSASIKIPEGKSGDYELVLTIDAKDKIFEYKEANNSDSKIISVQLTPWADLKPNAINFPNTIRSGQKLNIDYTLSNKGKADVNNQNWIDEIYLSKDNILDEKDRKIASVRHQGQSLNSGNSLNKSTSPMLPVNLDGFYHVIVKADAGEQIYEHFDTARNILVSNNQLNITQAPMADLEVQGIQNVNPGNESVTLDAVVKNNGPNQVIGNWHYAVHVSEDQQRDINDVQKGDSINFNQLSAGNTKNLSINLDYPVVKPGYYNLFLQLDRLNQIPETDEANNTYLLSDSFYIDFTDTLKVDQKKQDQFRNRDNESSPRYYQMDVGKDTGIYIQLNPANKNINTQIYTRTGAIPDRLNYDHKQNNPGQAEQNLIIPSQNSKRRDYISTRGSYIPHDSAFTPFSILAESKTFSIARIHPKEGSKKGIIIMGLYGFNFTDKTEFMMIKNDKSDTVRPIVQAVMNTTEGRAHFDLRDHAAGQYDVFAIKGNGTKTRLDQGFEILSKGLRNLTTSVTTPARKLVNDKAYTKVLAGNSGKINAYDLSLNMIFYADNHEKGELDVRFNGTDAVYEDLATNPQGKGNILDTSGIKYYSAYFPVMPSSSNTTFTFEMTSSSQSDVNVIAFWSRYPKTEWAFTGYPQELYTSRFIQTLDSVISAKLGIKANKRNKLDDCSEDLNIENMEKEIMDELKNQVICIHPFTPSAWAKRNLAEQASKGAFKQLGVKKGDEYAEFGKNVIKDMQTAKTWYGRAPKPDAETHYTDQIDFVFDCLQNNSDFREKFNKERCLYQYTLENTVVGDKVVIRNRCTDWQPPSEENGSTTSFLNSFDPNEIVGPPGLSELKLVNPGKRLNYEVLFENKQAATSPAQQVKISNPLPPEVDIKSFRLGKVGFGDTTVDLPDQTRATEKIRVNSANGQVILKVKAGLDPVNRKIFWTLSTIDPETGLPPEDPAKGFLPPNDSTGRGEGFVSYEIDAKENLNHGDSISNKASIIFDENAAIETNTWTNIISTDELQSKILEDYEEVDSTSVVLNWKQVTRKPFSTDLTGYNIYVSKDDKDYRKWLEGTPDQKARFTGEPDQTYYFISQAIGVKNQVEAFKDNYDVKVNFDSTGSTGSELIPKQKDLLNSNHQLSLYPNPSGTETHIKFRIAKAQRLRFKLTNIQGKVIANLKESQFLAGTHHFRFNPNNLNLEGGVYFLKMQGESTNAVKKWIYMR